ncbi:hypothetical protein [Hathewaya massiliensis]|uniref:hypothetical protein n=1 Tax=Hathewaya massiliensis TaxID=1964382 RepID=UPI00115BC66D|nr:hypothetical protein [Hathewaya massiliensis]
MTKIAFVNNRINSIKYLALISTDTTLTDEETIRIYGKCWVIEAFFKISTLPSFIVSVKN